MTLYHYLCPLCGGGFNMTYTNQIVCGSCRNKPEAKALGDGHMFVVGERPSGVKALQDVIAERKRQIDAECWSSDHDDQYVNGELAQAAACYAACDPNRWPWPWKWWKPNTIRRNLVKAGALILAEIERIDRQAKKEKDMTAQSSVPPPFENPLVGASVAEDNVNVKVAPLDFEVLRQTNLSRCNRWMAKKGGINSWDINRWAVACLGEAGEMCNAIKKLNRVEDEYLNINEGDRQLDTKEKAIAKIKQEIGDTAVYLDLIASRLGLNLEDCIREVFNNKSQEYGFPERL